MDLKYTLKVLVFIIAICIRTSFCLFGLQDQEIKDFVTLLHGIGQHWNITSIYILHHSSKIKSKEMSIILEELRRKDTYFAKLPQMSITRDIIEREFYKDAGFNENSMVLTLMNNYRDSLYMLTAKATRHWRQCFAIFAVTEEPSKSLYTNFFYQLRNLKLLRPLVILNGKEFLTMDLYPSMVVRNVTRSHKSKLFPVVINIKDYKGYKAHVAALEAPPVTYGYENKTNQPTLLDGLGSNIISEFAHHFHIQLVVTQNDFSYATDDIVSKITGFMMGLSDFSTGIFIKTTETKTDYIYPYAITSRCIMMPSPTPKALRLTDLINWPLLVFVLISLVTYEVYFTLYFHLAERRSIGEVLRSRSYRLICLVCVFLSLPVPSLSLPPIKYIRPWVFFRTILIYFTIILSAFYISHMLLTNFISLLTASYYKVDSPKPKDIFSNGIPLLVYQGEYDEIIQGFNISNMDVRQIVSVSWDEVNKKRSSLDTSYMYFVSEDSFKFIDEQQKYLNNKRFLLTDICHGAYSTQMLLRADSEFNKPLQMFILYARESGILQYLQATLFQRAKDHGRVQYLRDAPQEKQLLLRVHNESNMILMMITVLGIGYLVSILAFIVEILVFYKFGKLCRACILGSVN